MKDNWPINQFYKLEGKNTIPIKSLDELSNKSITTQARVALDEFNNIRISTIFLGVNCRIGEGEPLLFETMIFGGKYDQEQERYCTWIEAKEGHEKVSRFSIVLNFLRKVFVGE